MQDLDSNLRLKTSAIENLRLNLVDRAYRILNFIYAQRWISI